MSRSPVPCNPCVVTEGGRVATLLLYLTAVEVGGTTIFPQLGLSLAPSPGSLVGIQNTSYQCFCLFCGRWCTPCSGATGRRTAGCSTPPVPSCTATRRFSPRTQTGSHKLIISVQEKKENILYFEQQWSGIGFKYRM